MLLALERLRAGIVPAAAALVLVLSAGLATLEMIPFPYGLAGTILATLVLLLYIGMRPLVVAAHPTSARTLGAGLGALWLVACYLPFHARLFPGAPLVAGAQVAADGLGLPLTIPAAGRSAIDLLIEGHLAANPTGGAAPPVHFRLTLEDGQGSPRVVDGTFEDKLRTRRLGRRGTAVVHQTHTGEVRLLANPSRQDLRVTEVTLDPPTAQPITLTALPHALPGSLVLGLAAATLVAAVLAFNRLGPVPETDGALTLATGAVLGAAVIFWTSNAVHADFSTLIGSAIFGGPLGFGAGAALWWIAKRTIGRAPR